MNRKNIIELIDELLERQLATDEHLHENATTFVHDTRSVMANVYGLSSPELHEFNREIKSVETERPFATSVLQRKIKISRGALASAKNQLSRGTVREVDSRGKVQKIKKRLEDENWWVQQNYDGEDIHLMIGNKDDKGQKAHIVIDDKTGELRIEDNQKFPEEILKEIETIMTFPDGKQVRTTRKSMEWSKASGDRPNIIISRLIRDDQIMLELRNEGATGLRDMKCVINWTQHGRPQTRDLYQFFSPGQDVGFTSSSKIETIGANGHYIIKGLPQWADGGKIIVVVMGAAIKNGEKYQTEEGIEVGTPPPSERGSS